MKILMVQTGKSSLNTSHPQIAHHIDEIFMIFIYLPFSSQKSEQDQVEEDTVGQMIQVA